MGQTMALHKLTDTKLKRLTGEGLHSDGGNLHFRVTGKARSWVFRYTLRGVTRDAGLGPWPDRSLEEARRKAAEGRRLLLDGVDPIAHWKATSGAAVAAAAKVKTFAECVDGYIAAHEAEWRSTTHRHQWRRTLETHVYPILAALPVHAIDTGLVVKALAKVWKAAPVSASRIRGRVESVLDWAKAAGYRSGDNPAVWQGNLDHLLANPRKAHSVEHHGAMPYAEIASFLIELRKRPDLSAKALELTVLTGLRSGEVLRAEWSETDLANRVWTVPATRTKMRREHVVPLSVEAVRVLKYCAQFRQNAYVFPGQREGKPLSETVMRQVLRDMGRDCTVHGFRASLSTWRAEQTNFPEEVGEAVLAHGKGDKVAAAYNRADYIVKKRRLLDAWGAYCSKPVAPSGKVVALRLSVP
jgi:integrase